MECIRVPMHVAMSLYNIGRATSYDFKPPVGIGVGYGGELLFSLISMRPA